MYLLGAQAESGEERSVNICLRSRWQRPRFNWIRKHEVISDHRWAKQLPVRAGQQEGASMVKIGCVCVRVCVYLKVGDRITH